VVIFDQKSAVRWLVASAQEARNERASITAWLACVDRNTFEIARSYVTARQLEAITALVWSRVPML
jgi:hypothetical protein